MESILSLKWSGVDGLSFSENDGVVFVKTPQALVQAVGYAKYKLKNRLVFYRGQTKHYSSIEPTLYRTKNHRKEHVIVTDLKKSERSRKLDLVISFLEKNNFFLEGTPSNLHEAVLQHYGFKTRYLDFVDNIWVALWFASTAFMESTFDKKNQRICKSIEEYSYIYVVSPGVIKSTDNGIIYTEEGYEVIDLRTTAQSMYLRPHAQHGVVIKRIADKKFKNSDMFDATKLIIKISNSDAIKWLGNGELVAPGNLFPSPFYDHGYAALQERNLNLIYEELAKEKKIGCKKPAHLTDIFGYLYNYTY